MTTRIPSEARHTVPDHRRDLNHEARIAWAESIEPLDYVRETYMSAPTWRGRPPVPAAAARVIGYAAHASPETTGMPPEAVRYRRMFYLKPGDRGGDPNDPLPPDDPYAPPGAPCEAVDPRTVAPGVSGRLTERAWSGPNGSDEGREDE